MTEGPGLGPLRLDRGRFAAPQDVPRERHPAPANLQELIAVVRTNGESRGEQRAFVAGDDDFYLPLEALAAWVELPSQVPLAMRGDEALVRLRDSGAKVRFDESVLELAIDFPTDWYPEQVFTYRTGQHADITPSQAFGALVNYSLSTATTSGQRPQWNLATDSVLSWRGWTLTNELLHFDTSTESSTRRGLTQLVHDDPKRLTRFIAGDFFAAPTDLTGGLVLGGLSYARTFQIDPYLVRNPTAAYRGTADAPSDVDFYVGNQRIYHQHVAPGPFEIGNVSYITGQRDVRVVVRDASGHERTITFPFYFADRGLAQGVSDFSYQVGAIRENAATSSSDYGPAAFSASHSYGFTDHVTAGFHAEGTRDSGNVGPTLVLRSDALGIASLALLASHDREAGNGHAYAAGYSYQRGPLFASALLRRATRDFAFLRPSDSQPAAPRDDAYSVGYSPAGFGTVSLSYHYLQAFADPLQRAATATYSLPIGRDWSIEASYRRTIGNLAGYEALLTVQYRPRPDISTFTSLRQDDTHTRTASFQVSNLLPEGEGLGWSVGASHSIGPSGHSDTLTPGIVYRMREAVIEANVSSTSGSGERTQIATVSALGSVVYTGGHVGLSRPIEDSFSVVQIEPPLAGVRVYLNRQEVGRTDASGRVFLPRLVSYVENYLSIEDKDVPIEYAIQDPARTVVPYFRSANLTVFRVEKVRAITGTLKYTRAGRETTAAGVLFTLDVGGKPMEVPTASNGEFYFENVPAGSYAGSVDIEGTPCHFKLTIPPGEEPVVSIHDVQACSLP
ncbi:MAG TPA: fimbria/pilus outer membrane usher protein [Usitatibacter sp.]|nr:fimbria/pilus outer membrane usher protein [Usitatibacter sp.]